MAKIIDARLRDNVHLLGELLGNTIRAQHGDQFFDKIERIRKGAKAARKGSAEGAQLLAETLDSLDESELLPMTRAFNQFLNLANIAEQYHQVRRRAAGEPAPFEIGVFADLIERLKAAGHDNEFIARQVSRLEIELVLTAHPTEVSRRTLIQKYDAIAQQLAARDHTDLSDAEQASIELSLQRLIAEVWHTEEIRRNRPTPVEEAKWGFAAIENSLWKAVPNVLRQTDATLHRLTGLHLPLEAAPIRFASWMGGDRDGNPNVTAMVSREVLLTARWVAADLYLREIEGLITALSMREASDELLRQSGDSAEPYRVLLKPLRQLRRSAQALAAGQYDAPLPLHRQDEIGELSAAFGAMAQKVRSHTSELENRVRERTRDLEQANRDMAAAHKKIDDSIDYASLIQRSILPNRQLVSAMGDRHAVLWRPRDVVGGDFYVYRADDHGCLFGVVDCAGHGVPGALMTMLAHAAIDQALGSTGLADPAAALARTDAIVRSMLKEEDDAHALATNMDIGLAYVDLKRRKVHYSGAKIALYYCDGEDVHEVKAARRAIGDKRVGEYHNTSIDLRSGRTFYMTTDGFLDQAGGDQGYGFGNSRFASMIREHARRPLAEQGEAFSLALARYQGEFPQRDDITMLCFRFD